MADICINHPHREARRNCFFCKAPICPSCQHNFERHFFCSNECYQKYKSERYLKEVKKKVREGDGEATHARQLVTVRNDEETVSGKAAGRGKRTGAGEPRAALPIGVIVSQALAALTALGVMAFAYLIVDRLASSGLAGKMSAGAIAAPEFALEIKQGVEVAAEGTADAEFALLLVDNVETAKTFVEAGKFRFDPFVPAEGAAFAQVKVIDGEGRTAFSEARPLAPFFGRNKIDLEHEPAVEPGTPPPEAVEKKAAIKRKEKYVNSFERGRAGQGMVSLTFDGGADSNVAAEILNVLRTKGIRTTIFLTGKFIANFPELTRRIVADGHEVGNHTYSHPHLTTYSEDRRQVSRPNVDKPYLTEQLQKTEQQFRQVTGGELAKLWRAPYGEMNNDIRAWAAELGYTHVGWTRDWENGLSLDSLDWVSDPSSKLFKTSEEIFSRIVNFGGDRGPDGGIVLMHLGTMRPNDRISSKLEKIIDELRSKGLSIVPISKMLQGAASAGG